MPVYPRKCGFGAIFDFPGIQKPTLGATFSAQKAPETEYPELRGASWCRPGRDLRFQTIQNHIFIDSPPIWDRFFHRFYCFWLIFTDLGRILIDFGWYFHNFLDFGIIFGTTFLINILNDFAPPCPLNPSPNAFFIDSWRFFRIDDVFFLGFTWLRLQFLNDSSPRLSEQFCDLDCGMRFLITLWLF